MANVAQDATSASIAKHVREQTGHTIDTADYNQHGHSVGKQGAFGHSMPPNDADKQSGHHIPQRMYGNQDSPSGGSDGDGDCPEDGM